MARIRSIKPEYWSDRSVARQLSRDARLLYIALWNFADEHGRLPGDPRWVKGTCLPYDDDLDPAAVEQLLKELAAARKVIEYQAEGDPYLFLPNLARHQRLEAAKVPSRLPPPLGVERPGRRMDNPAPGANEAAPRANEPTQATALDPDEHVPRWIGVSAQVNGRSESGTDKSATDANGFAQGTADPVPRAASSGTIVALQVAGGREQVVPPAAGGADAPRADVTAQHLIAEYVSGCAKRPPGQVLGQLGKHIAAMIAEGVDPADIRSGLASWHTKGLHPSTLPSVVHEVMNRPPRRDGRQQETDDMFTRAMHRARTRDAMEATS